MKKYADSWLLSETDHSDSFRMWDVALPLLLRLMEYPQQERLLIGIMSCANCEWQLEETREYLRNRKAFGKTLSNLQVSYLSIHLPYLTVFTQLN